MDEQEQARAALLLLKAKAKRALPEPVKAKQIVVNLVLDEPFLIQVRNLELKYQGYHVVSMVESDQRVYTLWLNPK